MCSLFDFVGKTKGCSHRGHDYSFKGQMRHRAEAHRPPEHRRAAEITIHFSQTLFCFKAFQKEPFYNQEEKLHNGFRASDQPTRTH